VPRSSSAKKRTRQARRRAARNRARKSAVKTALKKARQSRTEEAVREAASVLDRAAGKGLLHPNQAARKKSRLAKLVRRAPPEITS
jgi:small subunit ribosomal protein S20